MSSFHKFALLGAAGATITVSALVAGQLAATASSGLSVGNVAFANPRLGVQNNVLAPGLSQTSVAWGNLPLANPDTPAGVTHYGYVTSGGGPLTQDPEEAFKTEPDKNVYLTMGGHHYLFQGHEGAPNGYVTRIDLDQKDPSKRVSLVADTDVDGNKLPPLDGITWDPFTPTDKTDLAKGGKLEALQVSRPDGSPITAQQLSLNPADPAITDLHTYGKSFATTWVTVHGDAGADDATVSAAAADATPFKRPENGVFRPGTGFGDFYFTETGDTSATSTLPGAYGAIFRLSQASPTAARGKLSPVVVGDQTHTGFDNIAFATKDQLLVVEDAGDGLHGQRNALDSGYLVDLGGKDNKAKEMTRWLAEGRDASALYDATTSPGYNDGDNEITGIHVSDGDASIRGILGAKTPAPFNGTWRIFWTQQHGDNITWELIRSR